MDMSEKVTLLDKTFVKYIPSSEIDAAIAKVAAEINEDYKNDDPKKEAMETLDIFWGCYEIMGVALVDMYSWHWLYEHHDATAAELKEQVIAIAQQVFHRPCARTGVRMPLSRGS